MAGHRRVLVVEDDPLVLMMILLDLQADGLEAVGAETAREAADQLAQAASLDAVVLDLDMRKADAFRFARAARQLNPALAVIFTSGVSQPAFEAQRTPGALLVAKPAISGELASRLRSLLDPG
jgi:CheY-like chemotaxis protein